MKSVIPLNEIPDDISIIECQIEARCYNRDNCVSWLYKSVIQSEISALLKRKHNLQQKESK